MIICGLPMMYIRDCNADLKKLESVGGSEQSLIFVNRSRRHYVHVTYLKERCRNEQFVLFNPNEISHINLQYQIKFTLKQQMFLQYQIYRQYRFIVGKYQIFICTSFRNNGKKILKRACRELFIVFRVHVQLIIFVFFENVYTCMIYLYSNLM